MENKRREIIPGVEQSAGGMVFRDDGRGSREWLLITHQQGHHTGFPKGWIGDKNPDETREQTAVREVREEGGVNAEIVDDEPIVSRFHFFRKNTNASDPKKIRVRRIDKTVWYFLMEYVSGNPEDHDKEVSKAVFVPEARVAETLTFENDRKNFAKMLDKLKKLELRPEIA